MTFTHDIVRTDTGESLVSIDDPSESGWGRALGMAAGQKRTVFQLGDSNAPKLDWLDLTRDWDRSIVTSWNGVPIYWGVITGSRYVRAKKEWTVKHVDFRALLSRRFTFGTNGYSGDTTDNILNLAGFSLKAMIPWIIWAGTQGATANYNLPIRAETGLPLGSTAGDQSGPYTRKFQDFNFTTVEAALQEVQTMPDGPDVDLEPKKDATTGRFFINLRVGSPLLAGTTWEFPLDSNEPALFDVEYECDGIKKRNVSFAVGTGSEMLMAVKTARLATSSVAVEGFEEYKGRDDGDDALQAHANADLATFSTGTEQWSAKMLTPGTEGGPSVAELRMGDTFRLGSWGDPIIPDGWTPNILVAIDGDLSGSFTPTFQPIGGE
ncbi:hypothetical protein E3T61_18475 [Cryobacterium lactosi]|uniref:Phage tail protein n=1 Tax=Cryobacterium lactosi TaxID=1259202 RepID=A0A4V3IWG1_9MICO|nr:hypothetical protein [Cryobacterium lactosi]TFD85006.1 hypothetical protein E3T61_18475 [Cryobacterium lactosi]